MSGLFKRLSRQFSISAPRMQVRSQLTWPWRLAFTALCLAIVGGLWWWGGIDFGQIFGGLNRRDLEARIATLSADAAAAHRDVAALRMRNMQLESDIAMLRGLQESLNRQQADALEENAKLKEELVFFQQFFADTSRTPGVGIHRLDVDTTNGDVARYSVLLVRASGVKTDFDGHLVLQAEMAPSPEAPKGAKPLTLILPDERPGSAPTLKLRFKYYQRLEGTFAIPPGYALRAVTARAFETGTAAPRASRTLTIR